MFKSVINADIAISVYTLNLLYNKETKRERRGVTRLTVNRRKRQLLRVFKVILTNGTLTLYIDYLNKLFSSKESKWRILSPSICGYPQDRPPFSVLSSLCIRSLLRVASESETNRSFNFFCAENRKKGEKSAVQLLLLRATFKVLTKKKSVYLSESQLG